MEAVTIAEASRLELAETAVLRSKMERIQALVRNPMGVEIKTFGSTSVFMAKKMPGPAFNTVRGFNREDINLLDDILAFYQRNEIVPQFELNPAYTSPELFRALMSNGYCQSRFHTMLYGTDLTETTNHLSGLTIRLLDDLEMDLYASIYVDSFNLPDLLKKGVAHHNKILLEDKRWSFYIAEWNGKPAAIASLYIEEEVAVLAAAATLPTFRERGIHQQLILARMKKARDKGVDVISGQASFASSSQNNMEKCGMKAAYTKGIWNAI